MRRQTWTLIGLEHAIGERVAPRKREIRLHLIRRHISVRRHVRAMNGYVVHELVDAYRSDAIEPVHAATIEFSDKRSVTVSNIPRRAPIVERNRNERHPLTLRIQSAARDIGARQSVEEIVGRAIFLKDDDDVLDLR